MRLHLLANESAPSDTAIRDEAGRAVRLLLEALGGAATCPGATARGS